MKKALIAVAVIVVVGIGAFIYATRPAAAPSKTTTTVSTATTSADGDVYSIQPNGSMARFEITETLRGKPFTAVGTTSAVTGDIVVAAGSIAIDTITVNARTFKTDSQQRDGAIARFILKSDDAANEFVTFKATSTQIVSGKVAAGSTAILSVGGDLTIAGVTKPATLAITLKDEGDDLKAVVEGHIKRSDYGLTIPNIPFVANVPDQFIIGGMFTATR